MKKESLNPSLKLSRRELFKLGGAALGSAILLGGCDLNVAPTLEKKAILTPIPKLPPSPTSKPAKPPPKEELTPVPILKPSSFPTREPTITRTPEPTKTATRTPEPTKTSTSGPTRTPTHEPTRTITPEPLKPPEIIKIDIPDLTAERYPAEFEDITSEVPEYTKKAISEKGTGPSWHYEYQQCGSFFIDQDGLRGRRFGLEYYVYDGINERFLKPNIVADGYSDRMTDEDKGLLNWPKDSVGLSSASIIAISCDGKILYKIHGDYVAINSASIKPTKYALIIADIPNSTKTVIKDTELHNIQTNLTDEGNKLLLSFPADSNPKRGTYLVDLSDWRVSFHTNESSHSTFLNEDGTLLYLHLGENTVGGNGVIYNTTTKEKTSVPWPTFLTSYKYTVSRNLRFIARKLGMFSVPYTIEGQWGIAVHTPEGFFMISSVHQRSFIPQKISNDGTITTQRGDTFRFEGGTYKFIRVENEKNDPISIWVDIVKRVSW